MFPMKSSGNGSAGSAGTHQQPEILEQVLRRLTLQQPSAAALLPQRKWMHVRINHTIKERRLAWYDPCDSTALDAMLRSACGLLATQQYLLLDSTMSAVAVSSSLPSEQTFELVTLGPAPGKEGRQPAVVVIDPISTGAVLSHQLVHLRGYAVVAVWSEVVPDELKEFVDPRYAIEFAAKVEHEANNIEATVSAVRDLSHLDVQEVMVGCETGVLLGDQLSSGLGVRGNGTEKSNLRRNKFFQTEAVRGAHLNACGQTLANSSEDVERFLREKPPASSFKAVVKPVEGAGSDGVFICDSPDEVRKSYQSLEGTKNVLGLTNYAVLLQEYLKGDEYVVDTVSRSGVHKCVAIWKYDKRTFNGSGVVYFGMRLMPIEAEPELLAMVEYTFGVLEALGIRNGAIHSEVKLEERGPVLIEANCRLHGGEGTWAPMAEACLGYSAVSAMLDAMLDPLAFAALPSVPTNFRAHAKEAKLRSAVQGTLKEIDAAAMAKIRSLPSYRSEMISAKVGAPIELTIDAVTACGNLNLVNQDLKQLEDDYRTFHQIVEKGIFKVH